MTNIKYLKENGLLEAHKQFLRMCNETYISPIEELDEADDNEQDMSNQGVDPTNNNGLDNGAEQANAPMGGDNPQDMGNQDMSNTEDTPMGDDGMGNDEMSGMDGMGEPPLDDSENPFGDDNDETAVNMLKSLFPEREIVPIKSRSILLGGGNIHCITGQVPLTKSRKDE